MISTKLIRKLFAKIKRGIGMALIAAELVDNKILTAKILINQMKLKGKVGQLEEIEFKVFSQFGDDGIIQYFIHHAAIKLEERVFVEFGVESYVESNTRFLLMNDNWRGMVIDGGSDNIQYIKNDAIFWKYDLTAICAFIDRDNINDLLKSNGFSGNIGILSIDIDGNDYWVWDKINAVSPVIVIAEYNSAFGRELAITVPYDPNFYRTNAHYSNLYWGASMRALDMLARTKGYVLVGANSAGNNVYFIRNDRLNGIKPCEVDEIYVESRFREGRYPNGSLSLVNGQSRLKVIENLPVYSVEHNEIFLIKNLSGVINEF